MEVSHSTSSLDDPCQFSRMAGIGDKQRGDAASAIAEFLQASSPRQQCWTRSARHTTRTDDHRRRRAGDQVESNELAAAFTSPRALSAFAQRRGEGASRGSTRPSEARACGSAHALNTPTRRPRTRHRNHPPNAAARRNRKPRSVTAPGYEVSPALLKEAADGINEAIDLLKDLGVEGTADAGRGFSNLELTGEQLGHAGVNRVQPVLRPLVLGRTHPRPGRQHHRRRAGSDRRRLLRRRAVRHRPAQRRLRRHPRRPRPDR